MRQRVAILGAGIIGLLTARLLLQRGVRVLIADRQAPGRAASWAGGGIVSPLYPWRYDDAVTALADGAGQAHAALARTLRQETGIDPEFNPCGLLMLAPGDADLARAWCRRRRRQAIACDREGLALLQPGLAADVGTGLWLPEIGNVRNPRLLQALRVYVERHPLAEVAWCAQVALRAEGPEGRLFIDGNVIACDAVMVCAGAWSAELLRPFGVDLPLVPVRGQMLQFAPRPGLLQRIVLRDGRYLIPRRDGRILAGSTLEYCGFDAGTTGEARQSLLASTVAILPALRDADIEHHWAGLRPGSPSGIPWIDRVPGTRVFVNAGHFRNGLLLAPAAAALGVALLLDEKPAVDAAPYALHARRAQAWV